MIIDLLDLSVREIREIRVLLNIETLYSSVEYL